MGNIMTPVYEPSNIKGLSWVSAPQLVISRASPGRPNESIHLEVVEHLGFHDPNVFGETWVFPKIGIPPNHEF